MVVGVWSLALRQSVTSQPNYGRSFQHCSWPKGIIIPAEHASKVLWHCGTSDMWHHRCIHPNHLHPLGSMPCRNAMPYSLPLDVKGSLRVGPLAVMMSAQTKRLQPGLRFVQHLGLSWFNAFSHDCNQT